MQRTLLGGEPQANGHRHAQVAHGDAPRAAPHTSSRTSTSASGAAYDDKATYEEIQICETAQDVLDIVQDESASMSLRSLVQALGKINRLAVGSRDRSALLASSSFQLLVTCITDRIPEMNPLQLGMSLTTLGKLRVPVGKAALQAYARRAEAKADKFYPRELATLLNGFASLRISPGKPLLDRLGFRAQQLLDTDADGQPFEPIGVASLLHSCAVFKYKNRFLINSALRHLDRRLPDFGPQGVSNCLWALAKLNHYSWAVYDKSAAYVAQNAGAFKPSELFNLVWAYASMRYHPGPVLGAALAYAQQHADRLAPADVASLFYALGVFSHQPGDALMAALTPRVEALLPQMSPAELCNVYWGLALAEQTAQPLFGHVHALLPDLYETNSLTDSLLRQAFQGWLAARLAGSSSSLPPLPPLLVDGMKRAWMTSVHGAETNAIAEEIVGVLKSLKIQHDARRPTKDGLVSIDVALRPGPNRFVALQIVREHDHTCNTGQSLGPLLLRGQILERNGWEVRSLRVKDYLAVDPIMRPLYVAEVVKGLGIRVTLPKVSPRQAAAAVPGQPRSAAAARHAAPVQQLFDEEGGGEAGASSSARQAAARPAGESRRIRREGAGLQAGSAVQQGNSAGVRVRETELIMQMVPDEPGHGRNGSRPPTGRRPASAAR